MLGEWHSKIIECVKERVSVLKKRKRLYRNEKH